jgi:glycosyltransferase EpsJ
MNKKISVVIPCYNVEKYVDKCLKSVMSQTYSNLEIIIINDGSTDNTAELIQFITRNEKRVMCIDQANSGVSAARNVGIGIATGEYISFVDSDDYLEPSMYEELYTALTGSDSDVAICDYNLIYEDCEDNNYSNMRDEVIDIAAPGYFLKYCCCSKPNNYIWTRLYKTDIVKKSGVRFENYKLGDDTLFNFKLLPYMKKAVHISSSLYNYLQRTNSNVYTAAKRGNLATVYADTFESLAKHYKQNGFNKFLEAMPIHAYTRLRSVIFYSRLAEQNEEEIAKSIKEGFREREIANCLRDTSGVDYYASLTSITREKAEKIKQIMLTAADYPEKLIGVELV